MTRGIRVPAKYRTVRADRNALIFMGYWKQGRIWPVAGYAGDEMFAHMHGSFVLIQAVMRELTPGPKGSGED